MKNEGKIVELLTDMLIKQDSVVEVLHSMDKELCGVKFEVTQVKSEISKLNLQTAENTRAILKIADRVETIADLENRVSKLEKVVYK